MQSKETCPTCHGEGKVLSIQARHARRRANVLEAVLCIRDYVFAWSMGLLLPGASAVAAGFLAKLSLAIWAICFSPIRGESRDKAIYSCGVIGCIVGCVLMAGWFFTAFGETSSSWAPKNAHRARIQQREEQRDS